LAAAVAESLWLSGTGKNSCGYAALEADLKLWSRHCGKPEAFRKGSGKAAL